MIRIGLGILWLFLAGCAAAMPPPSSASSDAQQRCERAGHWWRPSIAGGYCERT